MVFNKKQISKKSISEEKKKKIENSFKSKIQSEVEEIDDSQSSKFVVDSPNLNREYKKISNNSDLDFKEARREILKEIKNKRPKAEEKKSSLLGLNKSRKFLRGIGSRRKELLDSPPSSQQAIGYLDKSYDKNKKTKEQSFTLKAEKKENESKKTVKVSDIKNEFKPLVKKKLSARPSPKVLEKPKILKANYWSQLKAIAVTFLMFIFILFVVMVSGLYLGRWQGSLLTKFTEAIPLPAAYVNGQSISANTFLNDAKVLENYIKRQNQSADNFEIRKQTMDKLIEFEIIRQMAEEDNILLSQSEIEDQLSAISEGKDEIEVNLLTQELYGWDFNTYLEKVIKPLILKSKVKEQFYKTDGVSYIRETMVGLRKLISDDESRFYEIASEVNQDDSFASKGDLGWLKLGETSPEFELQLLSLKPGEISQVVETRYGYHIIKLEEKMVNEDDESVFHVSHVFMKRPSFENYLEKQIKKATIVTLIRI